MVMVVDVLIARRRLASAERILRRGVVPPSQFWFQVSPGSDADGLAPRALSAGSRAERSFITNVWPALDASSVCRKRSVARAGWPSMRRAAFARLRSAADCRSGGYAVSAPRLE